MKPLLVLLLIAGSLQAQSVADAARKERARQAQAQAGRVITATEPKAEEAKPATAAAPADESTKAADAKPPATATAAPAQAAKPKTPAAADPVEAYNKKLEQIRTSLRTLQDQETTLSLQLSQANNLVYAPVSDPASQQKALALVGQVQEQLAKARKEIQETKQALDSMLLQGPPKK